MRRVFFAVATLLTFVMVGPVPSAFGHAVVCSNDAQEPFFNSDPAPSRGTVQGATIIECTPSAPDAQRTSVQLQWENPDWENRGDPYVSFSNARFHRVYDSTSCKVDAYDTWRTRAVHTGTHGDTATKRDISRLNSFKCRFNN